jgi:lipopolysaccharide export system protein LptA
MMKAHFALALALAAPAAFAAPAPAGSAIGLDAGKPIAVNADSFAADLKAETGTYSGNVIVIQGDVRLHADEVTVAAPGGKASRMEARGHVVVDSPSGTAVGDTGTYDVAQQVVHLMGHVALTKDNSVMRGTALDVDITSGKARLTGGVAGNGQIPEQGTGRVQGLFVPAPNTPPARGTP